MGCGGSLVARAKTTNPREGRPRGIGAPGDRTQVAIIGNGVRLARVAFLANLTPAETPLSTIEKSNTSIGSGQIHLLLEFGDRLGSASTTIDKATGELVQRRTYQASGGAESDYRPPSFGGYRADYRFTGNSSRRATRSPKPERTPGKRP